MISKMIHVKEVEDFKKIKQLAEIELEEKKGQKKKFARVKKNIVRFMKTAMSASCLLPPTEQSSQLTIMHANSLV